MSFTKKDRNFQSGSGNDLPGLDRLTGHEFSRAVSDALHREYGQTHAAVKIVASVTHANQRTVKNWIDAKNAPHGHHLIELLRHSDCVLEMVLAASGRRDILLGKKLADARDTLVHMVSLIDELTIIERSERRKSKS
jgi:hypothetical protein